MRNVLLFTVVPMLVLIVSARWIAHSRSPQWAPMLLYQRPLDAMVDITNELGVAVLQDQAFTKGNFAFSPYGVASVLVVLYEGAQGESARQIHNTMRLPWNRDVTRIGFRDIHRHLRSYFTHEGYLSGMSLNKNPASLRPEYRQILRFYGYDIDLAMGPIPSTIVDSTTEEMTTDDSSSLQTDLTESTTVLTETPTELTENPTELTENPTELTETPTESSEMSTELTETTTELTETPTELTETTTELTETPMALTEAPTELTEAPTELTEAPTELTETPTVSPVTPSELTETLTELTEIPTELTETTTELTESPTELTDNPLESIETSTNTVDMSQITTITVDISEYTPKDENTSNTLTQLNLDEEFPRIVVPNTTNEHIRVRKVEEGFNISEVVAEGKVVRSLTTDTSPMQKEDIVVQFINLSTKDGTSKNDSPLRLNLNSQTEQYENTEDGAKVDSSIKKIWNETSLEESQENPDLSKINLRKQSALEMLTDSDTSSNGAQGRRMARAIRSGSIYPDMSLQLHNGMYDSHFSRGHTIYTQLPRYPFLVDGTTEELVPVMTYTTIFPFAYIRKLHTLALQFPLDDERYRLLLLLPVERRGLHQLIYGLQSYSLRDVCNALKPTRVNAIIPSFMVEGFVILTPTLQQLGIWDVFDPRRANLTAMSNDPDLYVRNIEQSITVVIRNYVEIFDIQTRTMAARGMTERFLATHPFLYFVMDTETQVSLMAGKIVDPLNSRIY